MNPFSPFSIYMILVLKNTSFGVKPFQGGAVEIHV